MTLDEQYGQLMLDSIKHYTKTGVVTENLVKTIMYIKGLLFSLDPDPRYTSLMLYIEYNFPTLEPEIDFIWEHLHSFEKYESQLNISQKIF